MAAKLSSLTPDLVQKTFPDFTFHITSLWARQFKLGLGYSSEEIHDDAFLPDVMLSCFKDGEFHIIAELNIDLSQLLHATQKFRYLKPVHVGETIVNRARIRRIMSKLKSANPVVILDILNEHYRGDELVADSQGTLFVGEPT